MNSKISTDNVAMLYVTMDGYDVLDDNEKLQYFWCNECQRFYHKAALGGECGCLTQRG